MNIVEAKKQAFEGKSMPKVKIEIDMSDVDICLNKLDRLKSLLIEFVELTNVLTTKESHFDMDDTLAEIKGLIDRLFTQNMRFICGADEKYCNEFLSRIAAKIKGDICLYVDAKIEMCKRIIEK